MPNGECTTDPTKMSKAWSRIYRPICKEFGIDVIAFDPYIRFSVRSASVHTFDLPVDIAYKIKHLIDENKKLKKGRLNID